MPPVSNRPTKTLPPLTRTEHALRRIGTLATYGILLWLLARIVVPISGWILIVLVLVAAATLALTWSSRRYT